MGASELVDIIRREAKNAYDTEYRGLEIGTVVSLLPQLSVRIDNMKLVLGAGDLMVCETLVRHKRTVALIDKGSIVDGSPEGYNPVELYFESVLQEGDRVLLQAMPGGQKYVIFDKVVEP